MNRGTSGPEAKVITQKNYNFLDSIIIIIIINYLLI